MNLDLGPFGDTARSLWEAGLSPIPCGGEDGKRPSVRGWGKWKKYPGPEFLSNMIMDHATANVGIITGPLSGVTVVDIDDPDLMETMLKRCGDTPLISSTPSGGMHLWYRYGNERSTNLRKSENLNVDVKANGGFVVVPSSIRPSGQFAGKAYGFISGSFADVQSLPTVHPDSLPLTYEHGRNEAQKGTVTEGNRNNMLFRQLLQQARSCGNFNALLDAACSLNELFEPPLSEDEVVKVAQSAWGYEARGKNWMGGEARVVLTVSQLDVLIRSPNAHTLYAVLVRHHGARNEQFAVSPEGMADGNVIPDWAHGRYRNARNWLVEQGFLVQVHKGGNGTGDPSLYVFGPASVR